MKCLDAPGSLASDAESAKLHTVVHRVAVQILETESRAAFSTRLWFKPHVSEAHLSHVSLQVMIDK